MKAENLVGYALAGFALGVVLTVVTLLVSVRTGIAVPPRPGWVALYLAILFVPAAVTAAIGQRKAKAASALPPGS